MNSLSCDHCPATVTGDDLFDFCWHCGADLCPACTAAGCCGRVPAQSGTTTANALYHLFGSHPPPWAAHLEIKESDRSDRS